MACIEWIDMDNCKRWIGDGVKEVFMASFQRVQKDFLGGTEVKNEKTQVSLFIENRTGIFPVRKLPSGVHVYTIWETLHQ
jgi:hypothetical protein